MNELADLLRELIREVQDLKAEVSALRGPMGHDLGDIHAQLIEHENTTRGIGGPLGYTIEDVVDRLGGPSLFNLEDVHTALLDIGATLAARD